MIWNDLCLCASKYTTLKVVVKVSCLLLRHRKGQFCYKALSVALETLNVFIYQVLESLQQCCLCILNFDFVTFRSFFSYFVSIVPYLIVTN